MWLSAVIGSAFLHTLALPNDLFSLGMAPLGFVALTPLFIALLKTPSWRTAARYGALFGALSTAAGSYWLAFFGDFSIWTLGGAVIGYAGYNYLLFGYLQHVSQNSSAIYRPLWLATVWAGYEYLKSVGFLGYPWGLIAYPLAQYAPLAQLAELTGTWGLSWLAALWNAALAMLWVSWRGRELGCPFCRPEARALIVAALLTTVISGFGALRLRQPVAVVGSVPMVLVQQNIDSWRPGSFPDALAQAVELSRSGLAGAPPNSLLVWSETSLRRPYHPADEYFERYPTPMPLRQFLRNAQVSLLVGAPHATDPTGFEMTNSVLLIEPEGQIVGNYGKQQLVPFAEQIPGWRLPIVQWFFREVIGLYGTWVPGSGPVAIPLGSTGLTIATPICFEDAFSDVVRRLTATGADVLVNLTNNSWSKRDSAQWQHLVAARLRTIENRRVMVRSSNSGFTGVIDAHGRVIAGLPMFTAATLPITVEVQRQDTPTLYQVWGDLWGQTFVLLTLWTVVRKGRRSRPNVHQLNP